MDPTRPDGPPEPAQTVRTIRAKFTNPLILNGGYSTVARIEETLASGRADLISIGKPFLANPDLVRRLRDGLPLTPPNPATFYAPGPVGLADGYTDYPTVEQEKAHAAEVAHA